MVAASPFSLMLLAFEISTDIVKTTHTMFKEFIGKSKMAAVFDVEDLSLLEILCEVVVSLINLVHLFCIWTLNGISFALVDAVIVLNMRGLVFELREDLVSLRKFYAAKQKMSIIRNLKVELKSVSCDRKAACPICLCNFNNNSQLVKLPCKHYFHMQCVRRWMEVCPSQVFSCPLCRQPINR